jgi:hypothetical protein
MDSVPWGTRQRRAGVICPLGRLVSPVLQEGLPPQATGEPVRAQACCLTASQRTKNPQDSEQMSVAKFVQLGECQCESNSMEYRV